jgi:hypothetical protein
MNWNTILTAQQLAQHWADIAKLDPRFAQQAKAFWENAWEGALHSERVGAWNANERETFVIASSYLALKGITPTS